VGSVQAGVSVNEPGSREIPPESENCGEIDSTTLAAARAGDTAAYLRLLRHYDARLRAVAWRVLHDADLMDDALQEVAVKALRGMSGFRGEAPLGAWLCRIAYTTSVTFAERRDRSTPVDPSELPDTPWQTDLAERVVDASVIDDALSTLPADQRIAVLLIDELGYGYAAAAHVLDVPLGTVASRVSTARARLRTELAPFFRQGGAS